MKKTILAIGICITGTVFAQQNQPDSIHIVLHENQNGNIRILDTIVPISQQQQLFTWMQANGWEAPPPPPGGPGAPMMFEHEIIIEGDSNMRSVGSETTTPRMMIVTIEGDSGELPPPPPGCQMRVIREDGKGENGDVVIMRHPMPPHPPGSSVEVNMQTKDTIIDGKKRTMIIKTERIILPEGVEAPPAPPMPPQGPKAPTPPTPPGNKSAAPVKEIRDLVVYPNPTSEIINVEFDVAPKEKTTLQVVDMNGKVIYSEQIFEEQGKHVYREINLSGKGKGTYTVEVKSAKKVIAEKVILQ